MLRQGQGPQAELQEGNATTPASAQPFSQKKKQKVCPCQSQYFGLSPYADKMPRQDIQSGFTSLPLVTSLQCTQQGAPAGLWSWAACYSSTRDTREAAYYTESPQVHGRGVTSLVGTEQNLPGTACLTPAVTVGAHRPY